MSPSSRRQRNRRQRLAGNHQRSWLWGRHSVLELLRARRWPIRELFTTREFFTAQESLLCRVANHWGIEPKIVTTERLTELCRSRDHQGAIARMGEFPYGSSSELLAEWQTGGSRLHQTHALWLMLDGLQDPHNFGAVLRSADVFGLKTIIVPAQGQAEITGQVVRSSAGAVHHLKITRVDDLAETAGQAVSRGIHVVAATEKAAQTVEQYPFSQPTLLVLGNEGRGIHQALLEQTEVQLAIPQHGRVSSLNAAVAAGIFLYEADRQRRTSLGS